MPDVAALHNEIRYGERLACRSARLYRRLQWASVFLSVIGGSAAITATSKSFQPWVGVAGAIVLAIFGAINLSVRPAEKAAAHEADAKRYAKLRTAAQAMDFEQAQHALNEARENDVAEIEPLRRVAFNDVMDEIGNQDDVIELGLTERLLAALA